MSTAGECSQAVVRSTLASFDGSISMSKGGSVSVSAKAKACGFSRPSFYQAQAAFEQHGLAGLIAHKPGPHGGHKLTPAVMQFLNEARTADPLVRAERLATWVRKRFRVQVHPRSIERQLLRKKKPR